MALTLNTPPSVRLSSIQANRVRFQPSLSPVSVSFSRRRLSVVAAETDANEVKSQAPDKAPASGGSSFNQLLGIKGAAQETNKWKIRLQLTKPVTWPPLVWGVVCGAAASGNFHWTIEDVAKSIACMLMSGPFLTGYTQTINDWYDREIDAINEPYRPIPSGAISENEVITQIWVLLLGGLGLAGLLDVWAGHDFPIVFYLALGGSLLSYIYSAPPLKLKQNGWIGNFALGASYISLPWWAGQALFGTLTPDIIVLTLLYSIAGLGIAIVNDFKSVEGDRALGLQSLPVAFGAETAKWICVGAIDITQLSVAGYLLGAGKPYYALALLALIGPQVFFQFKYFLKDPVKYDVKYQVLILTRGQRTAISCARSVGHCFSNQPLNPTSERIKHTPNRMQDKCKARESRKPSLVAPPTATGSIQVKFLPCLATAGFGFLPTCFKALI
ncbi:chlorophyll synthase [Cucumis melo var. makuwa]|uniref:Chlorophyll synthase, chloroplastic n=1 Tax=Cucumis melo var. makuwa TaxID=1194695 RepID=A0A5D3DZR0_CUCMM|nr:chlorophyll synthase [Cucumis melo var. makuwa]